LYCDDKITFNQYDELTLFLNCEEISRKIALVDMNDVDLNRTLREAGLTPKALEHHGCEGQLQPGPVCDDPEQHKNQRQE
jgi:hypothetical protein